jgi:uncharacterized protein DUF2249
MKDNTVTLDVREDVRHCLEPFGRILQTVNRLGPGQKLHLYAPFEPVPLFRVMELQGFWHMARPTRSGDWEVLFLRRPSGDDLLPETPVRDKSDI